MSPAMSGFAFMFAVINPIPIPAAITATKIKSPNTIFKKVPILRRAFSTRRVGVRELLFVSAIKKIPFLKLVAYILSQKYLLRR